MERVSCVLRRMVGSSPELRFLRSVRDKRQLEPALDPGPCGCFSHNGFLTRAGYRALDGVTRSSYVDTRVSVSALHGDGDDARIQQK